MSADGPARPDAPNTTMLKFGYPASLVAEWDHWIALLRPGQPTLGSLVLAARHDATAFGNLPAAAHADLGNATAAIEAVLRDAIGWEKINYLMLMMVDPHVHFHVLPRYAGERVLAGLAVADSGWPGAPVLEGATVPDPATRDAPAARLRDGFARQALSASRVAQPDTSASASGRSAG